MAKTIKLNYEGTEYTLEFTRRTVELMEKQGFVVSDVGDKPMSTLPTLFAGAFLAHHRFTKREIIDAMFAKIKNKEAFIGKLAEMYSEPLEAMMDEPEESEGNLTWEADW